MSLLLFLTFYAIPSLVISQDYHVLKFGAVGNGIADDWNAVRAALAAADNTNGGRVIFDSGFTFLTGAFNVTSNVILSVQGNILGSNQTDHYL